MSIPNYLNDGCLELFPMPNILFQFLMTLQEAKRAPFIHLLLYFMRTTSFSGASVNALASGIYVK
jgi:hypothetical protein